MTYTVRTEVSRTVIAQDGVDRFAFNDDGSFELLTPTANPTGNKVPTAGQLLFTKEYVSPQQTITSGGTLTLTHGLGAVPKLIRAELVCVTNDGSHLAGEIVELGDGYIPASSLSSIGHEVKKSSTEIKVIFGNATTVYLAKTAAGASESLTNANWRLIVRAWA